MAFAACFVLLFFLSIVSASSDPTELQALIEQYERDGNTTALKNVHGPSWVNSPRIRGTVDILWSCIATLTACVYTALHLNIPTEHGKWTMLWKKVQWASTAVIAPELVLAAAFSQFLDARNLQKRLRDILRERGLREGDPDPDSYDLEFCFWVVMGGVRLSLEHLIPKAQYSNDLKKQERFFPPELEKYIGVQGSKLVLSSAGVAALAELGHFIPVSKANIEDRSKANVIQKILVLTQILWMVIQCSVRAALGLPVELLEVHTLVHALCALVMYSFWIRKPLDIQETETLDCALHGLDGPVSAMLEIGMRLSWKRALPIIYFNSGIPNGDRVSVTMDDSMTEILPAATGEEPELCRQVEPQADVPTVLKSGDILPCGFGIAFLMQTEKKMTQTVVFAKEDISRLDTVSRFVAQLEGGNDSTSPLGARVWHTYMNYELGKFHSSLTTSKNYPGILLTTLDTRLASFEKVSSIVRATILFDMLSKWRVLPVYLISIAYGATHLGACNFRFPSAVEELLWKVSCFVIMALPGVLSPVFFFPSLPRYRAGFWELLSSILCIGWMLYVACRAYIIVESFLSLRNMPLGVFWMPAWLQMIPHL